MLSWSKRWVGFFSSLLGQRVAWRTVPKQPPRVDGVYSEGASVGKTGVQKV
jgi:hypothetical protein